MIDLLSYSPSALGLLDILERQSGLALEVVNLRLDVVRHSAAAGQAPVSHPDVAEEIVKAVRTGEVRLAQAGEWTFAVFPLRRVREVVGCLVASLAMPADSGATPPAAKALEEAGALARGILEADLGVHAQLAASKAASRRLQATLRFLGQLGTYSSDQDVVQAVLQAATIWFDLDCRIYERRPDGQFALAGALPGDGQTGSGLIGAERAAHLIATRRFPPAADLDDLGLAGRKGDVVVLPVGNGENSWLMLLTGAFDPDTEIALSAVAQVLGADLKARALGRPSPARRPEGDRAAFERRIGDEIERARRFDLGLGLILIGSEEASTQFWDDSDALANLVRPQLRASDLIGRLRTGTLAVVLVHASVEGAESVTGRLKDRLAALWQEHPGHVHLGTAVFSSDCASADELIALAGHASRSLARVH